MRTTEGWQPTRIEIASDQTPEEVTLHVLDKETGELVAEVEVHAHTTKIESHESYGITVRNWKS